MATLNIPITKAGNRPIEIDPEALNDEMFKLALTEGLKVLLNSRMTKVGAQKGLEGEELAKSQAAAYTKAEENAKALLEGKFKKGRATGAVGADGKKVPGVVMTEARRLAKEIVKNELRAAGIRISHVEASEITKAANALIEADPSFIAQATANIEGRSQVKAKLDIASLVHESPKLKAAAEARKAAAKEVLSAKQAGKAAPRKAQPTA